MKFTSLLSLVLLLSFAPSYCMDKDDGKSLQKLFKEQSSTEQSSTEQTKLPPEDQIYRDSLGTGELKLTDHWVQKGGRLVRTNKETLEPLDYPQQTGFIKEDYIWKKKPGSSYRRIKGATKISQFTSNDPVLDKETRELIRAEKIEQKDIKTKKVSYIKDANGLEGKTEKWKVPRTFFKECDSWQQRKATDSPDSFEATGDFWKLQIYGLQKLDPTLKRMEYQNKSDSDVKTLEGKDASRDKKTLGIFSQLAEDVRKFEIPQEELHRRIIYYAMLSTFLSKNSMPSNVLSKKRNISARLLQMRALQDDNAKQNVSQVLRIQAILKELYDRLDNDSKGKLPEFAQTIVKEAVSNTSDFQKEIDENTKKEALALHTGNQNLRQQKEERAKKMTTMGRFTKTLFG